MNIRIATRKSPLALWQANFIKQKLLLAYPDLMIELIPIITQGDLILDSPLSKIGGKGIFVKQLEMTILNYEADIAVHSIKDIPAQLPKGLMLAAIYQRDDVRDALVANKYSSLDDLPDGAVVGTSSLRRQCQLLNQYPHLTIKSLRGNVGTRLDKLDDHQYDAIILASVGLIRLSLEHRITQYIDTSLILPAVGQGAIGIESRSDDRQILDIISVLDDKNSRACIEAERSMNNALQGDCQVPIAGYSRLNGDKLILQGLVGRIDGSKILKQQITGSISEAETLGKELAERLLSQGANVILKELMGK